MYDSQTISEETANDLAIKFLINHRYLKHVRFDNKNLSQLHEIVKEKISDTKILNLFNNYMTSKDVSLFLRI